MIPIWKLSGRLGNQMFQLAYLYSQVERGVIPDIYVQDEVYFERARDKVRELFRQGVGKIYKVGIHVRRGDYVDNPFYVDLTKTDYYQRAMAQFSYMPKKDFIVFSDDIEWCKQQEIFKGCEFSEGNEIEDMNTLASCHGIIMANSSFSWWASYLSNAKVIAPKEWYTDGIERTKVPNSWLRL